MESMEHEAGSEPVAPSGWSSRGRVSPSWRIHFWVPIARGSSFEQTHAWVEQVSRTVAAVLPDLVSWKWAKNELRGPARLDHTQTAINKTLVRT